MLDAQEHARIIADIEHVCVVAGLQRKFLYESMKEYCGEAEIEWVQNFHAHREKGLLGLILEGVTRPDCRCQAIAAALVRNYIDARVIPLNSALEDVDIAVTPTVLLIPNLFVQAYGKTLPAFKIQQMYDLLLQRSIQNKPTVVYVESMAALLLAYGAPFSDFLSNYRFVKV